MKNKLIPFVFIVSVSVIAFIAASQKPVVANESVKAHSVVVLQARQQLVCVDQGLGAGEVCFVTDLLIYSFSSSAGAPTFNTSNQNDLPSLAQSLATLLNMGFRIEYVSGLTYTLVR